MQENTDIFVMYTLHNYLQGVREKIEHTRDLYPVQCTMYNHLQGVQENT